MTLIATELLLPARKQPASESLDRTLEQSIGESLRGGEPSTRRGSWMGRLADWVRRNAGRGLGCRRKRRECEGVEPSSR